MTKNEIMIPPETGSLHDNKSFRVVVNIFNFMMSSAKIQELVSRLSSKCPKTLYSALVCIRTKVIKEKHGLDQLLNGNAFDKILKILSADDVRTSKITDIVLSILGNVCMDKTARQKASVAVNVI